MCPRVAGLVLAVLMSATSWGADSSTHPLINGEQGGREMWWMVKLNKDYQHRPQDENKFWALRVRVESRTSTGPVPTGKLPVRVTVVAYQSFYPDASTPTHYRATRWSDGSLKLVFDDALVDDLQDQGGGSGRKKRLALHLEGSKTVMVGNATHTYRINGVILSGRKQDRDQVHFRFRHVDSSARAPCGTVAADGKKAAASDPCTGPVTDDILEESVYIPPTSSEPELEESMPYEPTW